MKAVKKGFMLRDCCHTHTKKEGKNEIVQIMVQIGHFNGGKKGQQMVTGLRRRYP